MTGEERRKRRASDTVLVIVHGLTTLLTILALIWVLATVNSERTRAREDSCILIKGLVLTGAPANRTAQVQAYIASTALADCHHYATHP